MKTEDIKKHLDKYAGGYVKNLRLVIHEFQKRRTYMQNFHHTILLDISLLTLKQN